MMLFLPEMLMVKSVETFHQSVRWQGGDKERNGSRTQSSSDELSSGGKGEEVD